MKKFLCAICCFFAVACYAETNIVIDNILSRTSVRKYDNRIVEQGKIDSILQSAMAAPSAINKQPWEFIVVTDKKMLASIAEAVPNASYAKDAAVVFIVCGNIKVSEKFWIQDCCAATENILLSANSLGLGAVWCAVYPLKDKIERVQKLFNLSENIVPLNVIPVGYPADKNVSKQKYNPAKIHINKW